MQVNIRLSKKLIEDIDYITQSLKVNRNDWLKVKLAELISREIGNAKSSVIEQAENKFVCGKITEQEFLQRKGFKPTRELIEQRGAYETKQKLLEKNSKSYARNYFKDVKKTIAQHRRST